jgi:3-methyladenine DNA glycosylase AlkD
MADRLPETLAQLKALSNEENRQGMARFGIDISTALGIKVTTLRKLGKEIGRDHALAQSLWDSGFHEARMLATIIDVPAQVTESQLEKWVQDLNSWDLTDGFTGNLVDKTIFAYPKAIEWSQREPEFEKRSGFALMAWLPIHDKQAPDMQFNQFFPLSEQAAGDDRVYVKKAVSWALRNMGKRSIELNKKAIEAAQRIADQKSKSAKWIASDVLRELNSEKIQARLAKKNAKK